MTTVDLLSRLRALGVTLRLDGDRLKANGPEGALTRELVAELAARKAELVALLREQAPDAPIRRADGRGALSFAQRRFWFFHALAPDSAAYQICFGVRLQGPLREDALRRSLDEILRRHEILRTVYETVDGQPAPVVRPAAPFPLAIEDLSVLGAGARAARFDELAREVAAVPFDLSTQLPVRGRLFVLEPGDHALVVAVHHIAADAWSVARFLGELRDLYEAYAAGLPSPLAELPIQYGDVAVWQQEQASRGTLDPERDYWVRQLSGLSELRLPTDRPRPPFQSFRGGREPMALDRRLADALAALARGEQATLFMTLLAGLAALLHRYTGQTDLAIGTAVAGRQRAETEALIGPFINSLVLRADASGDPTFRSLLRRVRETCLQAYAHQDLPFDRVVEALRPERSLNRNPLFQVMLALQSVPMPEQSAGDLRLVPFDVDRGIAVSDLEIMLWPTAAGLEGYARYSASLFDAPSIRALLDRLEALLEAAAADPERRLSALPCTTARERQQVAAWNDTSRPYDRDLPAHVAFERRAAATPDAPAIVWGGQTVSYRDLEARAGRIARELSALGVAPESCVAVCLERSPAYVAAALGVLKAGAAYLPLDPSYPVDRIAFMLRDADVRFVLTDRALQSRVDGAGVVAICLDGAAAEADGTASAQIHVDGRHLAYVIYTSGSTGTPKGVAVTHGGLMNLIAWHRRAYGVEPSDRAALVAGLGFDASVWELWPYLAAGACVHIPDEETRTSAPRLVEWLADAGVTICFVPTPLAEEMIAGPLPDRLRLRALLTGGDRLHRVPAGLPFRLFNNYGPTENTVVSTWAATDPEGTSGPPPIGRPVDNTRAYVLDARFNAMPVGVPGELFVAGDSLARGYLRQPALTAASFLPDPFAAAPGGRMYRTGDRVRWLPDGTLEFLGRIDHQVKIRGFRIELGEIEAVLKLHPGVRDAVVVARSGDSGESRLVAYVVSAAGAEFDAGALKAHLGRRLPGYMIPSALVPLSALPLTPNGKLDRQALPAPVREADPGRAPTTDLEARIAAVWAEVLGLERVGLDENFFDLGGHSLLLTRLHRRLCDELGCALAMTDLFQRPTVSALAAHLGGSAAPAAAGRPPAVRSGADGAAVAIVGMAGRFPGAPDIDTFWANLTAGVESISFFDEADLEAERIDPALRRNPFYVPARGVLDGADMFDARFFGYTPREAELLDPQQRVFLECAWEALEDAGYDAERYSGAIGVFAGAGANTYLAHVARFPHLLDGIAPVQLALANEKDFLATRASYKLNLRGPSVTIQTACSTSLVAVHLARRSLLDGECDLALAGGVRIAFPQKAGYLYQEDGIYSPDGHCRAFDAGARGTVSGSGAALVVLKRLEDAIRDGDNIYAVVRGSSINNDGSLKVGYTAPSVEGQADVIARVHAEAGIEPETIGYIEAHGTGTALGDPVEVAALTRAFRARTKATGFCALGSLKTNVGHLDAAAGVAGLIKAALAVRYGIIPPSLHFRSPNPGIDFASTPFYVNTARRDWTPAGVPRRAAVSSFGLGGTNAHVVLEEAPEPMPESAAGGTALLVLSARTERALERAAMAVAGHLRRHPGASLADVAYTLQVGRRPFAHRLALVADSAEEVIEALEARGGRGVTRDVVEPSRRRRVVFMFPGQGSQQVGMARDLYESEPWFRARVDECAAALQPHLGLDVRTVLYPDGDAAPAGSGLDDTLLAQPALFTVEYALARLWMHWGVAPDAMIGHSVGEYVAACVSGALSLDDAAGLVADRARLMQDLPRGAMLAVPLSEGEVLPLLDETLALAAVNSADSCVVSGPAASIEALESRLAARGIEARRLRTSHAFHSAMMEPVLERFAARAARVGAGDPRIPYVSNVTGTWTTRAQVSDPQYWAHHLRATVRFHAGVRTLVGDPDRILLEVGPGRTLCGLARRAARDAGVPLVASLPAARDGQRDRRAVLEAAGRLWTSGVSIDWHAFHAAAPRRRVSLPTYPFERERYWLDAHGDAAAGPREGAPERRRAAGEWLYAPAWIRTPRAVRAAADPADVWLAFTSGSDADAALVQALERRGATVVQVRPGSAFRRGERDYVIDPRRSEDYGSLWEDLAATGRVPRHVVHLWMASAEEAPGHANGQNQAHHDGFLSMAWLARAISAAQPAAPVDLTAVLAGAHDVTGRERLRPEAAAVLGACLAIPHECPGLSCRAIDVSPFSSDAVEQLVSELTSPDGERIVAFREGSRWTPAFGPIRTPLPEALAPRVRDRGVYLITGGLGGVGLETARELAASARARLALLAREILPPREDWARYLAERPADDRVARQLRELMSIEASGSELLLLQADVTDEAAVRSAIERTIERFGALHGVVHAAGPDKSPVPIGVLDREEAARQFRPRAGGLAALERALAGRPIDFCVVHSSLASVLGSVGHAAYAGAHAFMDTFVARVNQGGGAPWICVNWDNWRTWKSGGAGPVGDDELAMEAAEGRAVLRAILALDGARRVVVSTGDLHRRIARWQSEAPAAGGSERGGAAPVARSRHPRPELANACVSPRNDAERLLAEIWQDLLGIEPVGVEDNFFELGGDSVIGIQLVSRAAAGGLRLKAREIFDRPTIAELAAAARTNASSAPAAEQGAVTGPVPLTPIQRWFFDQDFARPSYFNQARVIEIRERTDPATLEAALRWLVEQHDALRMRFAREGSTWTQINEGPGVYPVLERIDLSSHDGNEQRRLVERIANERQASLDLEAGRLVHAVWFDGGAAAPDRLLLVIHHLVVDIPSWGILLDDLEAICRQLRSGGAVRPPAKTTSFKTWAERLSAHVAAGGMDEDAKFWLRPGWRGAVGLPVDFAGGTNTEASAEEVRRSLDAGGTARLSDRLQRTATQVHEALLAALAVALSGWTGTPAALVDVEAHGREADLEGVDLSRTVGWFTSVFPVLLEVDLAADRGDIVASVAAQFRAIPGRGLPYGCVRYLAVGPLASELAAVPKPEVCFLYLGRQDSASGGANLVRLLPYAVGYQHDPAGRRTHLIELSALVADDRLELVWRFSRELHRRGTIEALADAFMSAVREIASGGAREERPASAAEFPAARLTADELQDVLTSFSRMGGGAR